MPFYLTNENIEATMERNPDDIFNPSDINHKPSSRNTKIRQLILKEITNTFEEYTLKSVSENSQFNNVSSLKEDKYLTYLFTLETDNDEYEIIYYIPYSLVSLLEQYSHDSISSKEILLSLSNLIITTLNTEDFAFLQDIKLLDLCNKIVDYKNFKNLKNLYSLNISIDKKEYEFYLQLDNQFNKIF